MSFSVAARIALSPLFRDHADDFQETRSNAQEEKHNVQKGGVEQVIEQDSQEIARHRGGC